MSCDMSGSSSLRNVKFVTPSYATLSGAVGGVCPSDHQTTFFASARSFCSTVGQAGGLKLLEIYRIAPHQSISSSSLDRWHYDMVFISSREILRWHSIMVLVIASLGYPGSVRWQHL